MFWLLVLQLASTGCSKAMPGDPTPTMPETCPPVTKPPAAKVQLELTPTPQSLYPTVYWDQSVERQADIPNLQFRYWLDSSHTGILLTATCREAPFDPSRIGYLFNCTAPLPEQGQHQIVLTSEWKNSNPLLQSTASQPPAIFNHQPDGLAPPESVVLSNTP